MCRACHFFSARVALAIAAAAASIVIVEAAVAQHAAWNAVPNAMYPMVGADAQGTIPASQAYGQSVQPIPRGPLARLVNNPDRASGLPPFALADQSGMIQRYVEPVPGIDLMPYVGQVVVVRHDTGRTLLASQLELPPQPLYPMVGLVPRNAAAELAAKSFGPAAGERQEQFVQQAQYADDDDATVELFEEEALPNGRGVMSPTPMPGAIMYPEGGYPVFPETMPPGGPGFGAPYGDPMHCDPMQCDPAGMEWLPGDYGMAPCPKCGRYHHSPGYESGMGYGSACGHDQRPSAHVFADVEINFLRLHLPESAIGKLSEKYEFSPRFIAGFTGIGPIDGRVRYWLYGRETQTMDDDDEASIRLEFDVLDLEGTHHFGGKRSEVTLAVGLRLARIELVDEEDDADAGTDLLGMTLAADGRTRLAALQAGRLAWVYGGRLSILGGDWGGEDGGFVDERTRDDNVVVHELYAGLEFGRCYRQLDLRARLAFELQNWQSDVLAGSDDTDIESIGIVGPSIRVGAEF